MAHNVFRLLEKAYGVPHLITETALAPILDYLNDRNNYEFKPVVKTDQTTKPKSQKVGTIGEIAIDGALTYRPVEGMCGATSGVSYQSILQQAEDLVAEGVTTLILTHSSPGGEASHVFSTANDLRKLADENNVRLISYIDTLSASASLALQVVSDEVIIHPSANTGSIGCVVAIVDKSKAYAQMGLKPIYIASTPGKTPFENDGSFSEEFLAEVQDDVTRLGNDFAQHVSTYTGIPVAEILAMDAKMFHAEAALEAGLVNKIMDHNQFTDYVMSLHNGSN